MKPCPFCNAALNDNVAVTPTDPFCGACGRNSAAVRQSPTLPEGALAFQPAQPGGFGQQSAPPNNPQFGQQQQGTGGPQIGVPPGGQQFGNPSGPQIGVPPGSQQQFGNQQQFGGQQQFGNQQQSGGQQFGNQQGTWPPPPGGPQFGGQQQVGDMGVAPPGLNWGAFLIPFAWGPANKVYIGLLSLISLIPIGITQFISLGVSIYLLIKGNELAWKSGRPWQSVQEFQAVQKTWIMWGLGILVVEIILVFMYVSTMMHSAAVGGGGMPMILSPHRVLPH